MGRPGAIGAIAAAVLVAAVLGGAEAAAIGGPRPATAAEFRAMARALPARETLCSSGNARISASNRHFGIVIAQRKCGGAVYDHFWLLRSTLRSTAPWRVLETRSGSNAQPPGCARAARVPIDIRCY